MVSVAVRQSIRWLPDPLSEPTDTLVLTDGKSGVFLDVRFFKGSNNLDWAFAGYRHETSKDVVEFKHHIDSRTLEPLSVIDIGTNSTLQEGVTLEIGQMINPQTGQMTPYEEIWEEKKLKHPSSLVLFIRNASGTAWQAQVGGWQMALGRDGTGRFWAWQAEKKVAQSLEDEDEIAGKKEDWEILHSTIDTQEVVLLPEESRFWCQETQVNWNNKLWIVLD